MNATSVIGNVISDSNDSAPKVIRPASPFQPPTAALRCGLCCNRIAGDAARFNIRRHRLFEA